jgi:hypothetical protein
MTMMTTETTGQPAGALRRLGADTANGGLLRRRRRRTTATPMTETATRPHSLLHAAGRHGHRPALHLPLLPIAVRARPGDRDRLGGPETKTISLLASRRLRARSKV